MASGSRINRHSAIFVRQWERCDFWLLLVWSVLTLSRCFAFCLARFGCWNGHRFSRSREMWARLGCVQGQTSWLCERFSLLICSFWEPHRSGLFWSLTSTYSTFGSENQLQVLVCSDWNPCFVGFPQSFISFSPILTRSLVLSVLILLFEARPIVRSFPCVFCMSWESADYLCRVDRYAFSLFFL